MTCSGIVLSGKPKNKTGSCASNPVFTLAPSGVTLARILAASMGFLKNLLGGRLVTSFLACRLWCR